MKLAVLPLTAVLAATLLLPAGESAPGRAPLRVGMVVGVGETPNRDSLFGLPYAGFIRAVERLGVEGRVLQVAPNQDPTGPLSFLARQRYDLVIMGVADAEALIQVARDFPNTKFLMPDQPLAGFPGRPRNVQGTAFRAEEAGYLAGYLAALMEKRRPGRDVIGSVGGYKFSGVDRWIVGYRAGAKRADPGIETLNDYSNNFSNPTKCRPVALGQIARGAGAILNVAGGCGLGALEAAKEKGVWGIGVDVDQSFLGRHILTSAVIKLDVAVSAAMQRLVNGTLATGGDTVFDLRNGGVGLGKVSPEVPRSIQRQVDRIRRQIIAGRIAVPRAT